MEYISLGSDCSIAYQLSRVGLRHNAYPFDWVISNSGVINCISDDFSGWMDIISIKSIKKQISHIEEDWNEEKHNMFRVTNRYKITFLHDFTEKYTEEEFIAIKEKYKKRIERFNNVMKDNTIHKKLIRIGDINYNKLEKIFHEKGYVNYSIHIIPMINSIDWKKDEFDWSSYFSSM